MKPIKMDTTSLKLIGEVMIQVFTLWMDACSLKLIGEPMIQVPSFTLCTLIMMQSQRISSPKDCGEDYHKGHLPPSHGVPENSFDSGQIEDRFSNSKSIMGYKSSYSLPDPEHHESSYNLLSQWDPGEKPLQSPLFKKESTSGLTVKKKASDRILTTKLGLSQSLMVQEGTHNLNVTIKGYPKKFWACLVRKLTKHNKSHYFTPKEEVYP